MSEPTNEERARLAKDALALFTAETLSGDHPDTMHRNDLECAIADLISDLLHYADQRAFDPQAILEQGIAHFTTELVPDEPLVNKPPMCAISPKQSHSTEATMTTHEGTSVEPSDEPLLDHLDRNWVSLEAFGCFAALYPDKTAIFWCPMMADGSPEREGVHMNWGQVTAPTPEFVEKVNELFGTAFRYESFSGR